MFQHIVNFFSSSPPALDPVLVPWTTALIAGNIIVGAVVWALLKYIAKLTPWAVDDRIMEIITGAWGAMRDAVSRRREAKSDDCEDGTGYTVCVNCGQPLFQEDDP